MNILVAEPEMRISLENIKEHLFFKDIDWNQLKNKKIDPPFIPELEDNFSLEYFKNDNKLEMYHNPLFEFDQKAGIQTKMTRSGSNDRKFSGFGAFPNTKITKMLENF